NNGNVKTPSSVAGLIAHVAGQTFGLDHVLTNGAPDFMRFDSSGPLTAFVDHTYDITDLAYDPTHNPPTYHAGDALITQWKDSASGPVQTIITQDSYSYLLAVLGPSADRVAVERNADGRLEEFSIGPDHALLHRWQV